MDADPRAARRSAFFVRALVASAMVGLVCAVVGTYVVLRGIAFIGDAIAHAAFPGVVAAYLLGGPVLPRRGGRGGRDGARDRLRHASAPGSARTRRSACCSPGTFALGVFMFSAIQGYVADLFSFLFGNVLAIGPQDLVALLAARRRACSSSSRSCGRSCCTRRSTRSARPRRGSRSSGSSTCSSRSSRSRSSSASRPSGSSSSSRCSSRRPRRRSCSRSGSRRLMAVAALVGIASAVLGLYLSYWLDVASGATIVLVQTGDVPARARARAARAARPARRAAAADGARHGGRRRDRDRRRRPSSPRSTGRLPADRAAPRPVAELDRRRATATSRPPTSSTTRAAAAWRSGGRRSSGRSTCSRRSARRAGRPAGRRPRLRRLRARPPPPRDLHPLRPVARRRGPRACATSLAEVGRPVRVPRRRPTGWSCSGCAPRAERPAHRLPTREGGSPPFAGSLRALVPCVLVAIVAGRLRQPRRGASGAPTPTRTRSRSSPRRRCWPTSSPRSAATRVDVHSLVPKGGEVHTFDPTPSDVERIARRRPHRPQRPRARRLAGRRSSSDAGTPRRSSPSARTCRA